MGFLSIWGVVDTVEPSRGVDNGSTTKYERKRVEVDFVAYKGNQKYYIQSAFALGDSAKREQEIRPLLRVDDSFKKVMIVGTYTNPQRDENGILTLGIRPFLTDENSLKL